MFSVHEIETFFIKTNITKRLFRIQKDFIVKSFEKNIFGVGYLFILAYKLL